MQLFAGVILVIPSVAASAATLPTNGFERACRLRHTPGRTGVSVKEPTLVSFSNLRDGQRVRSPFAVQFAVRGMGVVPAGKPLAGTGHHHLLEVLRDARRLRTVDLADGRNETRLRFIDGRTRADLRPPSETTRVVNGQERL